MNLPDIWTLLLVSKFPEAVPLLSFTPTTSPDLRVRATGARESACEGGEKGELAGGSDGVSGGGGKGGGWLQVQRLSLSAGVVILHRYENVSGSIANVHSPQRALCGTCRACRALCRICMALWGICMALCRICMALWGICMALWGICMALWECRACLSSLGNM